MRAHHDHDGATHRGRRPVRLVAVLALAIVAGATVAPAPSSATSETEVTAIVSARSDWTSSSGQALDPHVSADGRFVVFTSTSTFLTPGVPTTFRHVYLHDLWTDAKTLISHDQAGAANASEARASAITKDGSHVAFVTTSKLDPADTNAFWDVYVWTRATGKVELASKGFNGAIGNGDSGNVGGVPTVAISDDGRYVTFSSTATNLSTVADVNGKADVFRRDRTNASTSWISLNGALQLNGDSTEPDMSADGRYIVWTTSATNLGGTDTNNATDVWLRDTNAISPVKVSVGLDADANGASLHGRVSDSGNLIAFQSSATDLVANDTNGFSDIFVRNRSGSTTTRVSVHDNTGAQLNDHSTDPDISPSGSLVAFTTRAAATVIDTNGVFDVYVRSGSTTLLESKTSNGDLLAEDSTNPSIDSSGDVAWTSMAQFAATDTNTLYDVFIRKSLFIGPFDAVDAFVSKQYERFRGSAPTAGAVAAETKLIRSGASPLHFIVTLADEQAFSGKRAPLTRLYWAYFKRRPDLNGLNYWLKKYVAGARLVDISQQFAKSNEFKTKYGNTTPEQFVTLVYQNVLERNPESSGLKYWSDKIRAGTPRGQVMTNFSESSEGKRVIGPRSDSILMAIGMYGKIPSQALFDAMVADRQAGWPREIIPAYILGAPEYTTTIV